MYTFIFNSIFPLTTQICIFVWWEEEEVCVRGVSCECVNMCRSKCSEKCSCCVLCIVIRKSCRECESKAKIKSKKAKEGKKNIFSGRCLEIEGLPDLKVEQAFELSDASAERSASGCTVRLSKEPIIEYLQSNIVKIYAKSPNLYSTLLLRRKGKSGKKFKINT